MSSFFLPDKESRESNALVLDPIGNRRVQIEPNIFAFSVCFPAQIPGTTKDTKAHR